jgi:WD40 repeat protein
MKRAIAVYLIGLLASQSLAQPARDALGDPLPSGALQRLGTDRFRAGYTIAMCAFLPDGKSVLTVDQGFTAIVWDVATGKLLRRLDLAERVDNPPGLLPDRMSGTPVLTPDGKILACPWDEHGIAIWDLASRKEVRRLKFDHGVPRVLAISADGKQLAVCGQGRSQLIVLYDLGSGNKVELAEQNQGQQVAQGSQSLEFSPDGRVLYRSGFDFARNPGVGYHVTVWDLAAAKKLRTIDVQTSANTNAGGTAAISRDQKQVAVSLGGAIRICDLGTGKVLQTLTAPNWGINTRPVFSPDGARLVVAENTGSFSVWDTVSGKRMQDFGRTADEVTAGICGPAAGIRFLAISPDGKTIAGAGGPALLAFNLETGRALGDAAGHYNPVQQAAFTSDGKHVVTRIAVGPASPVLRWNAATGQVVTRIEIPRLWPLAPQVSGDGRWLMDYDADEVSIFAVDSLPSIERTSVADPTIRLFDPTTQKKQSRFSLGQGIPSRIAITFFAPNSRMVAAIPSSLPGMVESAAKSRVVHIFDLSTGQKKLTLPLPEPKSGAYYPSRSPLVGYRVNFSPDGRWLAAAEPNRVIIFDTTHENPGYQFTFHQDILVRHVAVSPDGRLFAVELFHGHVMLLEVASAQRAALLFRGISSGFNSRPMHSVSADAQSLAFSPDGRLLARARDDGMTTIFDVLTGEELASFTGHRGPVLSLGYSPDARRLVTSGYDTSAIIWDLTPVRASIKPLPRAALDAATIDSCWAKLAEEPHTARQAQLALAGDPERTLPLLRRQLRPAAKNDPKRIEELIAALDKPNFKDRQDAYSQLEQLGRIAAPTLRTALDHSSAEVRRSARALLDQLPAAPFTLQQQRILRAVELLELIGSPDAVTLLKELAAGASESLPTPQAKDALARLAAK